ncbi:MAG: restriction endonuclease subunit S [Bacteroidales bacterium]|jgi:restriction endonuclease S subunit|nr:restriction endonuclease subunit S [Bacteroidales bacterium]
METTLLKFISFKDLYLWDVKRLFLKKIKSIFPVVPLCDYIQEESNRIKPADFPTDYHKILGVNNFSGIFDAYSQLGSEIKQPYKIMDEGFLAYNPYRVNVGSIGIKTKEHKHDLISPAYVVFSCKDKLKPEFLFKLFKTNTFNKVINENTTGSVRQNLTFDILKSLEIPLPTPTEQDIILKEYNAKMQEAEEVEKEVEGINILIINELHKQLGIQIENKEAVKNKLLFVTFKDIRRWDFLFLSGSVPNINTSFPKVKFADIISTFNANYNKSIRINTINYPKNDFRYIGMEHIEKETGILLDMPKVKGNEIKSQTLQVPKGFMLFGKLRPYLNKYWINNTDYENIICSSEFLVFDINEKIADKAFFKYVLSSDIIQQQITDKTSGARMPRINESTFLNLEFPLPDLATQKSIADKLDAMVAEQKAKRTKVAELKQQALQEFENAIFVKLI